MSPSNQGISGRYPTKSETPLKTSYRPEFDVSPDLKPSEAVYFHSLVGILLWIVELGIIYLCLEVYMLASHLEIRQELHLSHLLQFLSYLRKYHSSYLVINPRDPVIDTSLFEWKDFTSSDFGHVNIKEELPPKMPQPQGLGFVLQAKVDADHAADTVNRRSRTGFLIHLNCATVYWLYKKQNSVESRSFES